MTTKPQPIVPMMGHMTLDPGGIEMFATVMHLVYAHTHNPSTVGDSEHHKNALDYILAHKRSVSVERVGADAASATYIVGYPRRDPIIVRVSIGKDPRESLSIGLPNGTFIPLDFTRFVVRLP